MLPTEGPDVHRESRGVTPRPPPIWLTSEQTTRAACHPGLAWPQPRGKHVSTSASSNYTPAFGTSLNRTVYALLLNVQMSFQMELEEFHTLTIFMTFHILGPFPNFVFSSLFHKSRSHSQLGASFPAQRPTLPVSQPVCPAESFVPLGPHCLPF